MSRTGLIVALLLLVALGVGAILLSPRGGAGVPTGPLLNFREGQVVRLVIAGSAESYEITRTSDGEGWTMRIDGAEADWPATPATVRAALRILGSLTPVRGAEQSPQPAREVQVVTAEGTQRLRVGTRALAGEVIAERVAPDGTAEARGWVPSDVADMLADVRAWRESIALPGIGADVSRIGLLGEQGRLVLARVQGRWALREPIAEPADPEAVARLATRLGSVRIVDFLDRGAPADMGLDRPRAIAVIESDFRDPAGGPVVTRRRAMVLGRTADVGGRTLFARLADLGPDAAWIAPAPGARSVIVDAEPMGEITTDPLHFVSRRTLAGSPADVGRITLRRAGAEPIVMVRGIDGWAGEGGAALRQEDRIAGEQLLRVLSDLRAESLERTDANLPTDAAVRADLASIGGTPMTTLAIERRTPPASGAPKIVVSQGAIARIYAASAAPELATWLEGR